MNRLATEKSPYLLQHADNPVDWYPWGPAAFDAARARNRPIFLSVGYSTCHWCHVMAHESFESPEVAAVLNEHYVAIKVDREERPDVDRVYMTFVQATTGAGGWPMSVWLTPELEPFYGGTYFPPTARWGRPGFVELLREIARLWHEDRLKIAESAGRIGRQLADAVAIGGGETIPGADALRRAVEQFDGVFDERYGGFGGAPKFPRPSELFFLLREFRRTGNQRLLQMVSLTLRAMAAGGMRDHVGGGFHRYSVDGQWRVPHFEKMLYDQAQLVLAYLEAAQATGDELYLEVAEDTLAYVQRAMTDSAGGFYSAEDADSLPPGESADGHKAEGAFYLWEAEEIDRALGDEAAVVKARFGVRPGGNALQDPQGEFAGKNILYTAATVDDVARQTGRTAAQVLEVLGRTRQRMFEERSRRPRPHLDDKVLTAWNGLMIAAFARASRVASAFVRTDADRREAARSYLASARRAAGFIRDRMWDGAARRLLRRYRDGEAGIAAYAEDYACLILGLLELFQADGDPAWLEWATQLQARQDELFWDPATGGWFGTDGGDTSVRLRLKEDYDGAEPAASSITVLNLLVLRHLTGRTGAANAVDRTLQLFAPKIEQMPRAVPMMLAALSTYHAGLQQVVVAAGAAEDPRAAELLEVVNRTYLPFAVLIPATPAGPTLLALLPSVADMRPRDGRATAYVCRDFACQAPASDPAVLAHQLTG